VEIRKNILISEFIVNAFDLWKLIRKNILMSEFIVNAFDLWKLIRCRPKCCGC